METYIEDTKNIYTSILKFLEESDEPDNDELKQKSFQKLIDDISRQIAGDREEMLQFLETIKHIGEHHHRDHRFNERINQLLFHYTDQIKQTMSNLEIFHIFENNKKIVLFLLKNGTITISEELYEEMIEKVENNGNRYCHFFIPELENFEDTLEYNKIIPRVLLKAKNIIRPFLKSLICMEKLRRK